MTTITLKINEKSKAGKILTGMIELLSKNKSDVEIIKNDSKSGIEEAIEDIKQGTINSYKDSNELFKKVLDV
jgi:hypothetical protein